MKDCNKMQSQKIKPFKYIELSVLGQVVCKYCDKFFINKLTFFNIVPQLIKKLIARAQPDFIDLHAR